MVPGAHHRGAHSLGQGINSSTAHIAGHAITRSPLSPQSSSRHRARAYQPIEMPS
jgi:hypothetical protein